VINLRHQCDVMEPAGTLDANGQPIGNARPYLRGVPCSMEQVSGREGEVAHQTYGFRVTKVQMYGDPKKPIKPEHYLQFPDRRLEIIDRSDLMQNGQQWELICAEK
jgi:hypothetical protein